MTDIGRVMRNYNTKGYHRQKRVVEKPTPPPQPRFVQLIYREWEEQKVCRCNLSFKRHTTVIKDTETGELLCTFCYEDLQEAIDSGAN